MTTTTHHTTQPLSPLSRLAREGPEIEPRRLSFGFLTQTPSLPRVSQTHDPTTTTTSYALSPHPYTPPPIAVPPSTRETEPRRLGFVFLAQTPSPPHVSRTHDPTTTITSYAPPIYFYAWFPVIASHGAPETEPRWLSFIFLTQTPSPPRVLRTHDPTTTTTTLYAPPPYSYAWSPITASHGAPATEPRRLGLVF
ncbi:hypothetical protein PILCRDRAFT_3307 [Piloderma croceum F 1598]|uniref:Uncharacterized protein n=1 Tax=Piloderma croceum (strain F 1598) TaxID=765440 RepID=A0A0C3GCC3_PILCF|nr:hypothetical protein PILCRDRAFT_3307 [Piloderma croceum F 1598]